MNRPGTRFVYVLLALCGSASSARSGPAYDIIDLGVLSGGVSSEAYAINNRGDVVGYSDDGNYHAFLWSNGVMTELPGYASPSNTASDINDSGLVVGQAWGNGNLSYAVLWTHGIPSSLGDLGGNNGANYARLINNAGDVVGQTSYTADVINTRCAFLKRAGQSMVPLGPVGRIFCEMRDINEAGHVTGTLINLDGTNASRACLYDGTSLNNLGLPMDGLTSFALSINDSEVVAGGALFQYGPFTSTRAVLYKDGVWNDFFGGTPSNCVAINNQSVIVGTISSPVVAVIWKNYQLQQLTSLIPSTSGWSMLSVPNDINDLGQIVGKGTHNGLFRAFLMNPHKYKLKIRDAYGDTLPDQRVVVTRVSNNPPLYTERVVGEFVIDSAGLVQFTSDSIASGERFKVSLDVAEVPATKHTGITTRKCEVFLDNVTFDSLGLPRFDTLQFTADTQEVFIDHTTFVYDLVVSIEWDADTSLLGGVQGAFRNMANYLYDVTDGQARLGNLYLYDNTEHWKDADIRFWSDNRVHPHVANVGGIDRTGAAGDPVEMPRKWFGSDNATRNGTWTEWPLQVNVSGNYRTILHELGHYTWAFKDEYRYNAGDVRCVDHANSSAPYGFMDYQYDNGTDYCSEMSSAGSYANSACRNNFQWNQYALSCWSLFEQTLERNYGPDSIGVVVNMPDERVLPDAQGFLAGPNNSAANLDYDVGALVTFPVGHAAPVRGTLIVSCWDAAGDSVPNALVTLHYGVGGVSTQGLTSDTGRIRVLDYLPGDTIKTTATTFVTGSLAAGGAPTKQWLYGVLDPSGLAGRYRSRSVRSAADDSAAIVMNAVFGYYPIVFAPTYNSGLLSFTSWTPATFSQTPAVEHQPDDLPPAPLSVAAIAHGYSALLPTPAVSGTIQFDALDDSAHAFFAPVAYVHSDYDTNVAAFAFSTSAGDAELAMESAGAGIPSVTIVSSAYPVMLDGLESLARQAGRAHGVAFGGVDAVSGAIVLHYSSSDLESPEQALSLKVHRFNDSTMQWVVQGGSVDTAYNEVTDEISRPGVYALFTTSSATGVSDPAGQGQLPRQFELKQNYPNPFNPATTIEYIVPVRCDVTLEVFNLLGRRVRTLVKEARPAGSYRIVWDGKDGMGKPVSTGLYLYRFTAGDMVQTRKMLLIK
jgi:probable HAF family extracellular repeat protein